MDTTAYLKKQGWRGLGHSLDLRDNGIKRPLLISKKVDVLGVGVNKHAAVSDQWWLRAFDQGLKNFGTGVESALASARKHGVNRGGLYAHFVKGESFPGSIDTSLSPSSEDSDIQTCNVVYASPKSGSTAEMARTKKRKPSGTPKGKRARLKTEHTSQTGLTDQIIGHNTTGGEIKEPVEAQQHNGSESEAQWQENNVQSRGRVDDNVQDRQQAPERPIEKEFIAVKNERKKEKLAQRVRKSQLLPDTGRVDDMNAAVKSDVPSVDVNFIELDGKPMSAEKLAKCTERATQKGISLDEYIQRRRVRLLQKHGRNAQSQSSDNDDSKVEKSVEKELNPISPAVDAQTNFMIDTVGDDNLTPKGAFVHLIEGPDFTNQAIAAIRSGTGFDVTVEDGTMLTWHPNTPVPKDPRLWKDVVVKELPKEVREARRLWMHDRSAMKKARKSGLDAPKRVAPKNRAERKAEMREAFARDLLNTSRKLKSEGVRLENQTIQLRGYEQVPVLETLTTFGEPYAADEMQRARSIVRKLLKKEKRAKKVAKPKSPRSKEKHRSNCLIEAEAAAAVAAKAGESIVLQ